MSTRGSGLARGGGKLIVHEWGWAYPSVGQWRTYVVALQQGGLLSTAPPTMVD